MLGLEPVKEGAQVIQFGVDNDQAFDVEVVDKRLAKLAKEIVIFHACAAR